MFECKAMELRFAPNKKERGSYQALSEHTHSIWETTVVNNGLAKQPFNNFWVNVLFCIGKYTFGNILFNTDLKMKNSSHLGSKRFYA